MLKPRNFFPTGSKDPRRLARGAVGDGVQTAPLRKSNPANQRPLIHLLQARPPRGGRLAADVDVLGEVETQLLPAAL